MAIETEIPNHMHCLRRVPYSGLDRAVQEILEEISSPWTLRRAKHNGVVSVTPIAVPIVLEMPTVLDGSSVAGRREILVVVGTRRIPSAWFHGLRVTISLR